MIKQNSKTSFSLRKLTIIGVLGAISAILGMTPIGFIPVGPTNATIMHIPVIIGAILEGPVVGAMVGVIFGIFSIIRSITAPTVISPVFYNPLVSILPRVLIGITSYYTFITLKKAGKRLSTIVVTLVWSGVIVYLIRNFVIQLNSYNTNEIGLWQLVFSGLLIIITLLIGYFSYKKFKEQSIEVVLSAVVGTLTNTVGVLGMIYLLYGKWFVEKTGGNPEMVGKTILGVAIANGIPEAIVGMLIVTSVVIGIKRTDKR
ncbi:putative membrane protein [Gottschalkia purinilytica]|uniref:Putative membrane protein n=1 Tax=Gottschalkia purinilytica TaxID=1503 RepID=A0A0L0W935_GOTPU|nr:ECF transporter S component [Gottschalkia purinilytica]KNF07825.1 putative membrane protein [Gottschalkia purinilytica]